jgi:hypothetical protein
VTDQQRLCERSSLRAAIPGVNLLFQMAQQLHGFSVIVTIYFRPMRFQKEDEQ